MAQTNMKIFHKLFLDKSSRPEFSQQILENSQEPIRGGAQLS